MLYQLLRYPLFALPPEVAHDLTFAFAQSLQRFDAARQFCARTLTVSDPRLSTTIAGIPLCCPIGVAAGFDKNARILPLLSNCGFGFVEVGSVTARASEGNQKPRLFRLPADRALINRMGLNNHGPEEIRQRIAGHLSSGTVCNDFAIFVNIAKTHDASLIGDAAIADMVSAYAAMYAAARLLVINVSCPNTNDGKTFESGPALHELLTRLTEVRSKQQERKPLFVKFSPDISDADLDSSLRTCEDAGVDGYVLTNTTNTRANLRTSKQRLDLIGRGGLSGSPLMKLSLPRVARVYRALRGAKPIIGVGGISTPEDAYAFFKAGASAIEVYTALVYEGPGLAKRILHGLQQLMERDGISHISNVKGETWNHD